jgi:hypothetical protein
MTIVVRLKILNLEAVNSSIQKLSMECMIETCTLDLDRSRS